MSNIAMTLWEELAKAQIRARETLDPGLRQWAERRVRALEDEIIVQRLQEQRDFLKRNPNGRDGKEG